MRWPLAWISQHWLAGLVHCLTLGACRQGCSSHHHHPPTRPPCLTPARLAICHGKTRDTALAGVMKGEKEVMLTSYDMYRWVAVQGMDGGPR